MKIETRKSGREPPEMPFKINRALRDNIATQVTDGVRMAILSGVYKPGDLLPTVLEFAHGLGVSIRAPQAALRALTREGLVDPRPRLGTVVVGPKPSVFHGRVVIVNPNYNPVYYSSVLESRICGRLTDAGYLVTNIVAPIASEFNEDVAKERYDVRRLEPELQQNTKLVVLIGSLPHIEKVVSKTGTPFVVVGLNRPRTTGCAGYVMLDIGRAMDGVLARLRERKVQSLVQVSLKQSELMDAEALATACPKVEKFVIFPPGPPPVTQEQIVGLAMEAFAARYRTKADLPDAFLFTDDYLARGALLALLSAGFRTGRDVLVMTLSNGGITPIHPDPVDLLARDPARDAAVVSDAILAYLDTGRFPDGIRLQTDFVRAGER